MQNPNMTLRSKVLAQNVPMTLTVNSVDAGEGLRAFQIAIKTDVPLPPYLAKSVNAQTVEGLASLKDVAAFEKGTKTGIPALPGACVVSDKFLHTAQKLGFSQAVEELEASHKKGGSAGIRTDVYTAIVNDNMPIKNLVIADWDSDMLFKTDGVALPTGIFCDYIEAGMHNGNYDLEKLVALLKDDPRVTFIKGRKTQNGAPEILEIPYYNAEAGKTRYVAFVYGPTHEEAILLWEKMKSYGSKYPSTQRYRALDDLDMLGLVKHGIRKKTPESVETD